jgi:hypothetical protein
MTRLERKELQERLRIIEARVLALRAKGCKPHRIRRIYCRAPGSPILYHHADVLARSAKDAIRAAQEGRVTNWWMVDSFDRADHAFVEFQYLFQTSDHFLESAERRPQLPRRRPYPSLGRRRAVGSALSGLGVARRSHVPADLSGAGVAAAP